jgi:hypothetical protein
MCYCTPSLRTPWCHSKLCQDRLKIYQVSSDVPDEYRVFKTKHDELKAEVSAANVKLAMLVTSCKHPKEYVKKLPKGNTGNWCPDDDHYWYDCTCELCESFWTEDQ